MEEIKTFSQQEVDEIKQNAIREALNENNKQVIHEFARKINRIVADNLVGNNKKNSFATGFNKELVARYLQDPIKYEQELRKLSTVLMTMSPQYQQIMNYFSSIARYCAVISPNLNKFSNGKNGIVNKEKVKKEYMKAIAELDKMNIHHEFKRITEVLFREDIYYGYCHNGPTSFYIQQLDSNYCRLSSITDGCFNFQFNFAYFDSNKKVEGEDYELIQTFPEEFQKKYKLYKKDRRKYQWQELSEENTIAVKLNESLPFAFPTYASLFDDLSDLNEYKDLAKQKTEVDNYKFIGMQIPLLNNNKTNDFAIDVETAMQFYQMILNALPEGVGAFISATDFKDIDFGSGGKSIDVTTSVNNAEDNIFNGAGVSSANLGKNANTNSTIKSSNTVDSARLFKLYRQFERWLNRRFKRLFDDKFSIVILDVTEHSSDDMVDRLLKLGQYGVPVKLHLASMVNINQNAERGLAFLENEILNLHEEWRPLVSSHTSSNSNNPGQVGSDGSNAKKDKIGDAGEQTAESDANADR